MSARRRPQLRRRLLVSYLVVVSAGAVAMFAVATWVTRSVFRDRVGGFGLRRGQGAAGQVTESQLLRALDESLLPALAVGVGAAMIAAAIAAVIVGGRLLRPIDEMRDAARAMAAGDYGVSVPVPDEAELAALAGDVNALGEHLAATERRRTQLLAEVTHELRTPITVIRARMESLLDGVSVPSDEIYAAVIDETARMQRLVDDLTLLSRAEEGTLQLRLAPVDLAAVAAASVELVRPQFDLADVALVPEPEEPGQIVVLGDRDRLTQIIANLVGNALAHTPAAGRVTVRWGCDDRGAHVDVIDTGDGIAADDLGHIFERFYRGAATVDRTGRPGRAGRGLGLTIARGLARAHGGDVVASSPGPGRGASFRLTLPLQR